MRAAVANGANAVYFGLEDFNARRKATNFRLESLGETMAYLHQHNVRGYVAFNTLVFSEELERAQRFLAGIAESGADAVIVQDLGVARLARTVCPDLPVHASTQMTQTHAEGLELLGQLGISRVILARELSLREIRAVAAAARLELEVFVHGALCISYSGQCLASESLFGRSANRGLCAQPCRLPYDLVVNGRIVDLDERKYLLSPCDLAAWDLVPQLIEAGVQAFKIEGRLKSPEYVAVAPAVYRQAIDAALAGAPFSLSPEQAHDLAQSFSRGFTHGWLEGNRHQQLVPGRSPKNRGLAVGRVVGRTRQGLLVRITARGAAGGKSDLPLKPGDGVLFESARAEQPEVGGRLFAVTPADGSNVGRSVGEHQVELSLGRQGPNLANVALGSTVWKTDDPQTRRRLQGSFAREQVTRPSPLSITVRMVDGCLLLNARDEDGRQVEVRATEPLPAAQRHHMGIALLRAQLGRLGGTPFELGELSLIGPLGPAEELPFMAPTSLLNSMRRQLVQKLTEARALSYRRQVHRDALASLRPHDHIPAESHSAKLTVLVREVSQLHALCDVAPEFAGLLDLVYLDLGDQGLWSSGLRTARRSGLRVGLAVPRIVKPGEQRLVLSALEGLPDAVLVRSLPAMRILRQFAASVPLVGDASLNAANELAVAALAEAGLSRWTPSLDLNRWQLAHLLARTSLPVEFVLHAQLPMFHTAHCLLAAGTTRADDCGICGQPCRRQAVHLRDRNGVDHPVLADAAGRSTVYQSKPQSAVDVFAELAPRVSHWRIELLQEDGAKSLELVRTYAQLLTGEWAAPRVAEALAANGHAITPGTLVLP